MIMAMKQLENDFVTRIFFYPFLYDSSITDDEYLFKMLT